MYKFFTATILTGLLACAPAIRSGSISDQSVKQTKPEPVPERKVANQAANKK